MAIRRGPMKLTNLHESEQISPIVLRISPMMGNGLVGAGWRRATIDQTVDACLGQSDPNAGLDDDDEWGHGTSILVGRVNNIGRDKSWDVTLVSGVIPLVMVSVQDGAFFYIRSWYGADLDAGADILDSFHGKPVTREILRGILEKLIAYYTHNDPYGI